MENAGEIRQRVKKRAEFAEKFKSTTAEQEEEQMLLGKIKMEEEKKAKQKILQKNRKGTGCVNILFF